MKVMKMTIAALALIIGIATASRYSRRRRLPGTSYDNLPQPSETASIEWSAGTQVTLRASHESVQAEKFSVKQGDVLTVIEDLTNSSFITEKHIQDRLQRVRLFHEEQGECTLRKSLFKPLGNPLPPSVWSPMLWSLRYGKHALPDDSTDAIWYYDFKPNETRSRIERGHKKGPVAYAELENLLREGEISKNTQVCNMIDARWRPLSQYQLTRAIYAEAVKSGTGSIPSTKIVVETTKGSAWRYNKGQKGVVMQKIIKSDGTCSKCNGSGKTGRSECKECEGTGNKTKYKVKFVMEANGKFKKRAKYHEVGEGHLLVLRGSLRDITEEQTENLAQRENDNSRAIAKEAEKVFI